MEEYLIKNTTREQREKIVDDALGYGDIGCENAVGAAMYEMYQPYIDGKMELSEITKQYQTRYVSADYGEHDKGGCGYLK
ncbi:hypothetical protein lbkm_0017 [Lachnospiraceae bacterium KM106-2]|nr:hypothetical protein lbkm_0017 [Lachnospiraceae bacterium KM106-2]